MVLWMMDGQILPSHAITPNSGEVGPVPSWTSEVSMTFQRSITKCKIIHHRYQVERGEMSANVFYFNREIDTQ